MSTTAFLRRAAGCLAFSLLAISLSGVTALAAPEAGRHAGYYRFPAIHGDIILFAAEGDLWSVSAHGGEARRLTTNTGDERLPYISPDGQTVAFEAQYEGPGEVYTMPISGGLPERRTWDGGATPEGWTPDGRLIVSTTRYSTLPDPKIVLIDTKGNREILPLASAAEGVYSPDGQLFFTRWDKQPSATKRYKGGSAENLWRFDGKGEAVALTSDYDGTSHNPMFWNGHIYFLSDRDGIMNIWSMTPDGKDLKQLTHQKVFDVQSASISDGRIAYASGADLWLLDVKTGQDAVIPVQIASDYDQLREHWVKKPLDYQTAFHIAPDGSSAVFTARGEVFTLPAAKSGRTVRVAGNSGVRYRDARFLPDGKSVFAISTESGETEFWQYPANGIGKAEQWTNDSKVQRTEGIPSPDGRWLAHHDRDQQLWIYDIKNKIEKRIAQSIYDDFDNLTWSPDSRWLAYTETAANQFQQIKILNVASGAIQAITSDRYNSNNPAWTPDGKWLYFLSNRSLKTTVPSPWGLREPEPHFDRSVKIYELGLTDGLRSPFLPYDELHKESDAKKEEDKKEEKKEEKKDNKKPGDAKAGDDKNDKKDADKSDKNKADKSGDDKKDEKKIPEVKIDFASLADRVSEVPAPAGNYTALQTTEKRICWLSAAEGMRNKAELQCLDLANKGDEPDTVMNGVGGYEISADRKKMLVQKEDDFFILDSDIKSANDSKTLDKASINFSRWNFSTNTREEYRAIFTDAWRMQRDYFYDCHMHGVDWPAMRDRYLPLVDRVSSRDELNDVIEQMVAELSVLHTFVFGGDERKPEDQVDTGALGARLRRDEKAGGFVVEHIYRHDPDLPNEAPPFAKPDSHVAEGEIITAINGQSVLDVSDERVLLRSKAGTPVLLTVKSTAGAERQVLVTPIAARAESDLRYNEWEYTRRLEVEKASADQIGYVHLRAMGTGDIEQWARDFYPVYNRAGLIIDVRHNGGGNIDSWLLSKLIREPWMYFAPRIGAPSWNMQYAFRGHIVVLCDEDTGSDGEAFSEGIKRLKLGKLIGTRTWGGEVWLSFDNRQEDKGIATAAEIGVYSPEGKWLIEGHGVEPDIPLDNLPHATYSGGDAQLQAAIDLLKKEIKEDPRPVPPVPAYPDKSFHNSK